MSIKNDILEILNTTKFYYKGVPINALFLPVFQDQKERSVRNRFNELYKEGYINKTNNSFIINKKVKNI